MAQLNANTPFQECYVNNSHLYRDSKKPGTTYGYIFGVKSQINRPLMFHVQLCTGAVFWSVPLNQIKATPNAFTLPVHFTQIWNSQSFELAITKFQFLENKRVDVRMYDIWLPGRYQFTIDNYDGESNYINATYASHPDEKVYHFIELDTGQFVVYPNNHLRWHNKDFINPYNLSSPPEYKAFKEVLDCEFTGKTAAEDEKYFYNYR